MLRLPIIGHQGGWDEILMVVAPIAIIWAVLAELISGQRNVMKVSKRLLNWPYLYWPLDS